MNQAVISAFLPSVACLCLGLIVLRSGHSQGSGKIYLSVCFTLFSLSMLYLFSALLYVAKYGYFFSAGLAAGWALLPAILLHFSLLTSVRHRPAWKIINVLLYLPAAAFFYRGLAYKVFSPDFAGNPLAFTVGPESSDSWRWAYLIYFASYCTVSAVVLFRVIYNNSGLSRSSSYMAAAGGITLAAFLAASGLLFFDIAGDYSTAATLLILCVWLALIWIIMSRPEKKNSADDPAPANILEEVIQHMNDLLLLADGDGRIIRANRRILELLGYFEGKDIIGRHVSELIVGGGPLLWTHAGEGQDPSHTGDMQLIFRTRDGDEITVSASSSFLGNGDGKSQHLLLVGSYAPPAPQGKDLQAAAPASAPAVNAPLPADAEQPELKVEDCFPVEEMPLVEKAEAGEDSGFRDIVDNALVGIFMTTDGALLYANRRMAEIFGYQQKELAGSLRIEELVVDSDCGELTGNIDRVLSSGKTCPVFTFKGRRKDGALIDIEAQGTSGELNGQKVFVGSVYEITERIMLEEAIRHEALHDPLTSLPNRILFSDRVDMAIAKAERDKSRLAVLFLDLDRFKSVNDTLGHSIGDMLLQSAAGVLRGCLRDSDSVARLGGDEFTILLASINQEEDAIRVARKILAAINQKWNLAGHRTQITTSLGMSIYPNDGADSETLIRKADTAMYSAKAHGGNTIRLYAPIMDVGIVEQMLIENDLRMALDQNEFFIQYQPQFDMASKSISGVEALLRWNHPERGIILPDNFIPIAEKTGLIVPIGEWVLSKACIQLKKWHDKGHSALHLAVNISGVQLKEDDFVDMVQVVLKKTAFDPGKLKLEITESVALQNLEAIVPKLSKLTEMGVQFAIDDFGVGYCSLHYLKRLPITTIKIDRSFMRGLSKNEEDSSVVTAVIAMAKSLEIDTIAEGVENREQMAFLNRCHCDKVQGFLYSRPLSPGAFELLLR